MREHALPQDITGYRFHIIGNMTLKQFAEVGIGCGVGFLIYTTNLHFLIKWSLIAMVVSFGAMAAFVPVAERPFDQWFIALIRALYRPTKFFWKKDSKIPDPFLYKVKVETSSLVKEVDLSPARRQRVIEFMRSVNTERALDKDELEHQHKVEQVLSFFELSPSDGLNSSTLGMSSYASTAELAYSVPSVNTPALDSAVMNLHQALGEPLPEVLVATPSSTTQTAPGYGVLNAVGMTSGASPLQSTTPVSQTSPNPPRTNSVQVPEFESVRLEQTQTPSETVSASIPTTNDHVFVPGDLLSPQPVASKPLQATVQSTTLPFPQPPTEPNKVVGMVLDQANHPIPSAIVEIITQTGIPARAVKTNILGQFFITTPLNNGTYTIQVEKDGYQFQPSELQLSGQVINPIEVRSL